jgi:hypothetical protein
VAEQRQTLKPMYSASGPASLGGTFNNMIDRLLTTPATNQ